MDDARLLSEQVELEIEGFRLAEERFKESLDTADPATLPGGKRLIRMVVPELIKAVEALQVQGQDGIKAGRKTDGWEWHVQQLPADKLAFITVACALRCGEDHLAGTLTSVARNICTGIQMQIEHDRFVDPKTDDEAHKRLMQAFQRRYPNTDRWTWMRWRRKIKDVQQARWSAGDVIQTGTALVHALVAASAGAFKLELVTQPGMKTQYFLCLSDEVHQMMLDIDERASISRPLFLPMVVPPRPWRAT